MLPAAHQTTQSMESDTRLHTELIASWCCTTSLFSKFSKKIVLYFLYVLKTKFSFTNCSCSVCVHRFCCNVVGLCCFVVVLFCQHCCRQMVLQRYSIVVAIFLLKLLLFVCICILFFHCLILNQNLVQGHCIQPGVCQKNVISLLYFDFGSLWHL